MSIVCDRTTEQANQSAGPTSILHSVRVFFTLYEYSSLCTSILHSVRVFFTLYEYSSLCTSILHSVRVFFTLYEYSSLCTSILHSVRANCFNSTQLTPINSNKPHFTDTMSFLYSYRGNFFSPSTAVAVIPSIPD